MSNRRASLFISHSSGEDELAKRVIAELRTRVEDKLDVLLDAEVLDAGQRWRDELWSWWSECDAAVVVCSEAALKSRWVLIEVSVLMRRKQVNPHFPILPLLIHPVAPETIRQALFHDQNLEELQVLSFADATFAATLEELAAKLAALQVSAGTGKPLVGWEQHLAVLLEKEVANADDLAAAAHILGTRADTWLGLPVQARVVAQALLECDDPAKVGEALAELAPRLQDKVQAAVDLVAPAWLRPEEVAPVANILDRPHGSRAVALRSWVRLIADWYMQRAWRSPDVKPIEFPAPTHVDQIDEVLAHIEASVRSQLRVLEGMSENVLQKRLAAKEAEKKPVFVLVPIDTAVRPGRLEAGMLEPLMDAVRNRFPTLSFFCMAGSAASSLVQAEQRGRVVVLPHDEARDDELSAAYGDALD
jgi:hypothetical protein